MARRLRFAFTYYRFPFPEAQIVVLSLDRPASPPADFFLPENAVGVPTLALRLP
jgi:hypothetical protein